MKYLLVDSRMRNIEIETLKKLGYEVILVPKCKNTYEEISSHVDIFVVAILGNKILEPSLYNYLKENYTKVFEEKSENKNRNIICGESCVEKKYPLDVQYNVCTIGKNVVHNFKYTDKKIAQIIEKENLNKIQISQGYSNCSIAVISENSVIVEDEKIAKVLKENNVEVLKIEKEKNIHLLDEENRYSKMRGFIGGTMARLGNNIVVFGDISKFKEDKKITEYILKHNLNIIDFKGLDLIDYGGVVEI